VALTQHVRAGPFCAAESFHHIHQRRCANAAVRPSEVPAAFNAQEGLSACVCVNRSLIQPASQIRRARSAGTPVHRLPERPGLRVLRHAFESCSAARNQASEAAALAAPAGRRHEAAAHYHAGLQRAEQLHARKHDLVRARARHETRDWPSLHVCVTKVHSRRVQQRVRITPSCALKRTPGNPHSQPGTLDLGSQAEWERAAPVLAGSPGHLRKARPAPIGWEA